MQLRYATTHTSEQYVSQQAWREASLTQCPWHPADECNFKRNGTYGRKVPAGTRVPRWYCPQECRTVSLLADCLAAKLSGSLAEVEQVVEVDEQARNHEVAAEQLRVDIELPGSLRWVRRRRQSVHAALVKLIGLLPGSFDGCEPTLLSVRARLGTESESSVLPVLRELGEQHLQELPPPVGFGHRVGPGAGRRQQHDMGPRAPPEAS